MICKVYMSGAAARTGNFKKEEKRNHKKKRRTWR